MTPQPNRDRPRPARTTFSLGNLLIVFGIALFGSAVTVAATAPVDSPVNRSPVADVRLGTVTPDMLPSPAAPPAPVESLTPTPDPSTSAQAATPAVARAAATPTAVATPTPTPTPSPSPTPEPTPKPAMPHSTHIRVAAVGIDTNVVDVGYDIVTISGQQVIQWRVADYAAGHHILSANPGEGGNIVITGHDDWRGEVFRNLNKVKVGDEVVLSTSGGDHRYAVAEIYYRKEVGVPLEERLATGMFMAPMPEERITLITCWPYGVDDHRLIVVAKPIS